MCMYTNQGIFPLVITTGSWSGMDKGTHDEVTEIAKRSQDKGTFSVYFNLALQHTMLLMLFKVVPIPIPVIHGLLSTYYNQPKSCVAPLNYMAQFSHQLLGVTAFAALL